MSEDDLTSESSDEVGMIFASGAVTFAYCTYWYECGWPSLETELFKPRDRAIIDASSDALHNVIFSQ